MSLIKSYPHVYSNVLINDKLTNDKKKFITIEEKYEDDIDIKNTSLYLALLVLNITYNNYKKYNINELEKLKNNTNDIKHKYAYDILLYYK